MFLMYIDESGDVGTNNSPTNYFILSAIVLHETNWQNILDDLILFRKSLKKQYGLLMKEEIHAAEFVNGGSNLKNNITRNDKLDIMKKCLKWLDNRTDISIVTVRCDKNANKSKDIFDFTWKVLIQRFDNTLAYNNFPNATGSDKGLIISDNTNGGKLTELLRKMRRFNQIPNALSYGSGARNMTLRAVVEDPVMRDSANSYFHQMVDVVAYFAKQHYEPNKYIRKKGARTFYTKFLPNVTNPHVTRYSSPNNIVEV
jgi:hypothetical protein